MRPIFLRWPLPIALAALLGACAQIGPVAPPEQPQQPPPPVVQPPAVEPTPVPTTDPMAEEPGEAPLPSAQGAVERIDCMTGTENWQARIAFEAHGGQVTSFAYYSKWKPRTCALDFERDAPGTKWRLTAEGDTRVHTPQGRFLIQTRPDSYVFEFEQVQRQKFCGMDGEINGTMTVKRGTPVPKCSAVGILDTNDELLDDLYGKKQ